MSKDATETADALITIRMRRCGMDSTLNGYVFADRTHAHRWLSQPFVDRSKVELDEVLVSPPRQCRSCGGSGYHQDTRLVRRLTNEEVLHV